jgi:dihydrodipicolinate synthase/N-acetylneuraminate lyase
MSTGVNFQTTLPPGAMVALATPFRNGKVDPDSLARLLDHVVAGGVVGVCTVGSTGEGPRLSPAERIELSTIARERVPASIPVIPAVPVSDVSSAVAELSRLREIGATAALVSPPSYFPSSGADLARMYRQLAENSSLPIAIYNIPQFTSTRIPASVVGELSEHPLVVGIKDSSRDLDYLHDMLLAVRRDGHEGKDFRVYTGADSLLVASLLAGADGIVAASCNVAPRLVADAWEAFRRGDTGEAMRLQWKLHRLVSICRRSDGPAGWKAALALLGLTPPEQVPPAGALSEAEQERIRQALKEFGLSVN